MLINKKLFDEVERILQENGTIDSFEKEHGPIKGRMMITITDAPGDIVLANVGEDGVYAFEGSFDFYDSTVGILMKTESLEVKSGVWVTPQDENADVPDDVWIEFFIKTLVNNIAPDGSFGVPMYTFLTDHADFTVVPAMPEE